MDGSASDLPDVAGETVIEGVEEDVLVLSDGHVIAHQISEAVDVVVSIEEEMMLEAAMIEDVEEH